MDFFQSGKAQKAYEKIFKIINYEINANQSPNEIFLHTDQNGYHQEDRNSRSQQAR